MIVDDATVTLTRAKHGISSPSSSGAPGERLDDGQDDPAWRWNTALRRVLRRDGEPHGAAGDHPDAGAEDDPNVALLTRYLRCRCGELSWLEIDADDSHAIHHALRIWSDRGQEHHTLAFELEAGVVAGLPPGAVLPANDSTPALVQHYYECLFFDVRDHLADREWLLLHIFSSPWQATRSAARGFKWKVIAYAVGTIEYAAWIAGVEGLPTVRRVARRFEQATGYLDGLHALGLALPDDAVNTFRWLFERCSGGAGGGGDGIRAAEARVLVERLSANIPNSLTAYEQAD